MERENIPKKELGEITRREFLKDAGLVVGGAAIGSTVLLAACAGEAATETVTKTATTTAPGGTTTVPGPTSTVTTTAPGGTATVTTTAPGGTVTSTVTETASKFVCPICGGEFDSLAELRDHFETVHPAEVMTFPLSEGYLVVDSKKCSGCLTCMLACSLAHEGKEDLSLSRIQVLQDAFEPYPDDVFQAQCRQCVNPLCVQVCPTGACHVDTAHGNVRVIDESLCIGCKLCIEACPFIPHRTIWNPEKNVAIKCDLCINTPYWDEEGGPGGKQACVEVCPNNAIKFTAETPTQKGDEGYVVNLRQEDAWGDMGWPTD